MEIKRLSVFLLALSVAALHTTIVLAQHKPEPCGYGTEDPDCSKRNPKEPAPVKLQIQPTYTKPQPEAIVYRPDGRAYQPVSARNKSINLLRLHSINKEK